MSTTREQQPRLILEDEQILPCGYAPRSVLQSRFCDDRFFVGCKDGSLAVVETEETASDQPRLVQLAPPPASWGPRRRAVRTLRELDAEHLLVGRSNGAVEVVAWRDAKNPAETAYRSLLSRGLDDEDGVRYIAWLGPDRLLISLRHSGIRIFEAAAVWEALRSGRPLEGGQSLLLIDDDRSTLRVAVRTESHPQRWLMVTSRGGIWIWDETDSWKEGPPQARPVPGIWSPGEAPGFVNDIAVIRSWSGGPVQAIFLATEIGIYFINLGTGLPERAVRLSLPGLGAVCMAITYTRSYAHGFLWAADTRGDSHLFWRENGPGLPEFRPSGIVHVGNQVMLALSCERPDGSLVFVQARRNDSVALTRYTPARQSQDYPGSGTRLAPTSSAERLRALRHLLLYGSLDQLRQELARHSRQTGSLAEWPEHAVLADFFELLAENDDTLRVLQEYLSNPSAEVAGGILMRLPGREPVEVEIERPVRLWNLTLLGIVNRMRGERETSYLGVIRWLRDLERCAQGDPGFKRALAAAVQRRIRFARKWGLFGEANARRGQLVGPLEALRAQLRESSGIEVKPEDLDLLTYEALLFHRSFDVLLEDNRGYLRGRTAWDLSTLEAWGRKLVAVSWTWGGVELFELRRNQQGSPELDLLLAVTRQRPAGSGMPYNFSRQYFPAGARREPSEWWQRYGYSRAVLLCEVNGRYFMLTGPTLEERASSERLHLWEILRKEDGRLRVRRHHGKGQKDLLDRGESVYSFLELEEGLIVAGLRGIYGNPRIALVKLRADASRVTLDLKDRSLHTSGESIPSPGAVPQNRIWSLASAQERERGGEPSADHRFAVGCEGGEILQVTLPRGLALPEAVQALQPVKVAQMSAPVVALSYLCYRAGPARDGADFSRIFAGGADGSVVAWQELPAGSFSSLWATAEQGPIAAIHPLSYGPPDQPGEPVVIAVARSGRCVIFDDHPEVTAPDPDRKHPQRPRYPGARLGRIRLAGTAFACRLIDQLPAGEPIWNTATGRYAVLLTASEHGRLRLLSLHDPELSAARREHYENILELWWRITRSDSVVEAYDRVRVADALYQAVRLLPLILVQWALDPGGAGNRAAMDKGTALRPPPWQMPRYLRPLLRLRKAWDRFSDPVEVGRALDELLRHAWRLDDLDLFQQLCAAALKRANFDIFRQAGDWELSSAERLADLYLQVLDVIDRAQQRWLGAPERSEGRARMVVAKAMIDGDTFWKILQRAAKEKGSIRPFSRILERRVEAVRQLVFKRDSLVSLETLRALNLSLMRLCKRLVEKREPDGKSWRGQEEPSEQEVHWPVFQRYFEELTYAAARAFRSRLELNDSLAHEYCRTFALAVCACPSAAIRIANRMTETQLISDPKSEQDLSQRVVRQFEVLDRIGIPVPDSAIALFKIASRPPEQGLNPVRPALRELGLGMDEVDIPDDPGSVERFGVQNTEDLYCLCRIYRIVNWIVELTGKMSTDAREIDLTHAKLEELEAKLGDEGGKLESLYLHSTRFWREALASLRTCALRETSGEAIRPEMVLRSRLLERWAEKQVKALDSRYRALEIFQPEYPIFREAIARLGRAAAEFSRSAAVQKNIVLAVFGHHLLEDLDEHVLELEELAQNLDPLMVWKFRDHRRTLLPLGPERAEKGRPAAQRFAEYLLRRAYHAESIPKNLRSLHGILDAPHGPELPAESLEEDKEGPYSVEQLLQPFRDLGWTWTGLPRDLRIGPRAFQCLSLVLTELESNHRKHSRLSPKKSSRLVPTICSPPGKPFCLEISFRLRWDEMNVERLGVLQGNDLQAPLMPQTRRDVPSTGAGLYLANLTASVVNWRLLLREVPDPNVRTDLAACTFALLREGGDRR